MGSIGGQPAEMLRPIPKVRLNDRPISVEEALSPVHSPDARNNISNESSQCEETFRSSFILKVFCFHWLVSVGLFAAGAYLTIKPLGNCTGYYLIVYLQLGFWVGTYMVNDLIKPSCRKMLHQDYRLYRRLSKYRKRPLQIVSVWNTVLIATQEYASKHIQLTSSFASEECNVIGSAPQIFIVAFSGLQMLALTMFYVPACIQLKKIAQREEPSTEFAVRMTRSALRDGRLELTIEEQLMKFAEEIKQARRENEQLRSEAKKLGIDSHGVV